MLELVQVDKTFSPGTPGETKVFEGFSLTVPEGQFLSIVGGNGSGKTTLLNILCGSVPIDRGEVRIEGRNVEKMQDYRRYAMMGRVYQDPSMGTCPSLTVLENLSLADNKGRRYGLQRGVERKRIDAYRQMLAELGLGREEKLNVKMGSLSGGQRQALALLMATMTPLKFLILDEHTAALDPKTAAGIMELTDRIVRKKKLTALMVTHNLRYALDYGDRLLMLDRGKILLDRTGAEKAATSPEDVLSVFQRADMGLGFC